MFSHLQIFGAHFLATAVLCSLTWTYEALLPTWRHTWSSEVVLMMTTVCYRWIICHSFSIFSEGGEIYQLSIFFVSTVTFAAIVTMLKRTLPQFTSFEAWKMQFANKGTGKAIFSHNKTE